MAVTITNNMTLVDAADSTTGWTISSGKNAAVTAAPRESTLCIGYQASTNQFNSFYHVITAVNFNSTTLFVPWMRSGGPGTTTQGGFCGVLGDGTNRVAYHLGGIELFGPQVRGFTRFRLDSANLPATTTTISGTPASINLSSISDLGGGIYSTVAPSGQAYNNWFDIVRYIANGSVALTITGGTTGDRGTWAEIVTLDESTSNAWGVVFAPVAGGKVYEVLFGLEIGDTTAATNSYFDDSDFQLFLNGTDMSAGNLDMDIVGGTGTNLFHFDNFAVISVGTAGAWTFNNEVDDLSLTNGSFTGSGAITFPTNTGTNRVATAIIFTNCGAITQGQVAFTGNTFTGCGQVTAGGGDFTGSTFSGYEGTANTSYLVYDQATNPDTVLQDSSFTKGTAATHAIEFGTSIPSAITLRDIDFSGYNASNNQNDSALHFKDTSGTITVTLVGTTQPSYRTDGAIIEFVTNPVTVKVIASDTSGSPITGANVFLYATSTTGSLPAEDTVTIVNSGTTATVTHTAHGLATNDYVWIVGASHSANNGVFQITVTNANTYTYTMGSSPGSSPTGTITSTFVFLKGDTDGSGERSMTKSLLANQSVAGWARKSTTSPYYRQGSITGTVSSSSDTTFTAVLIADGS